MSLLHHIQTKLKTAIKSKNEAEKSIIRIVLGELATAKGRTGNESSDEDVKRIIKKIIQNNEETMEKLTDEKYKGKLNELKEENNILLNIVPKAEKLNNQELKDRLILAGAPIIQQIKEAKSEGQAYGACIKYLKSYNWDANPEDIRLIITEIRERMELISS